MTHTDTLAQVYALLDEAFVHFGQPEQANAAVERLLDAREILSAALSEPIPTMTPAAEIHARIDTPFPIPLSTGFTVEACYPDLLGEMLAGTLPNRVLDQVVWGKEPDADSDPKTIAEYVRGLLNIAARAITSHRLVLDRAPDATKNEIGIAHLRFGDLLTIRQRALWDALPGVQDAPFPASPA
jgi:hypothetical protein